MTTAADQLRQALEEYDELKDDSDLETFVDAARFALRVWEGDQQLVEKVAKVIAKEFGGERWPVHDIDRYNARAVLAAIGEEGEK